MKTVSPALLQSMTVIDGKTYVRLGPSERGNGGICLGNNVVYSTLAREIKKQYPDLKVIVNYPEKTGVSSIHQNNPDIDILEEGYNPFDSKEHGFNSVSAPREDGNFVAIKCRKYGLENPELQGKIVLTKEEVASAEQMLKELSGDKPCVILVQNASCVDRDWPTDHLEAIVSAMKNDFDFYQIEGTKRLTLPSARQELRFKDLRTIFALMATAKRYIGTNTGLTQCATCFSNNNIVWIHPEHYKCWGHPFNANFRWGTNPQDIITEAYKRWGSNVK